MCLIGKLNIFKIRIYITLCDKVCQWLAGGQWFSPGIPISNKTDRHDLSAIFVERGAKHNHNGYGMARTWMTTSFPRLQLITDRICIVLFHESPLPLIWSK